MHTKSLNAREDAMAVSQIQEDRGCMDQYHFDFSVWRILQETHSHGNGQRKVGCMTVLQAFLFYIMS